MGSNWDAIGFFRWPITFCFLIVLLLGLLTTLKLYRGGASAEFRTKVWLDGILPWGLLAFLGGILGSVTGIVLALQSIEAAGAVRPTLIAPGIKQTLLSMAFGTVICGFAVLLWYILQLRWRLLEAAQAEGES
ncbi:MAG: MotA/TolQ/ExbB proton channel family protein [Gemmatimonadota bacterium]|jgi:hypothetical protein